MFIGFALRGNKKYVVVVLFSFIVHKYFSQIIFRDPGKKGKYHRHRVDQNITITSVVRPGSTPFH